MNKEDFYLVSSCCKSSKMIEPDFETAENAGSLYSAYACYICKKCGKACTTIKLKNKLQIKFRRVYLENRWRSKHYNHIGSRLLFGLSKWYSSPSDFCYKIAGFGFEISIWFKIQH